MKKLSLNGSWSLDIPGIGIGNVSAQVPGSVYHDLLTAGLMEDPFYRDNEMKALKLMDNDFVYSRSFAVEDNLRREFKPELYDLFLQLEFSKLIDKYGLQSTAGEVREEETDYTVAVYVLDEEAFAAGTAADSKYTMDTLWGYSKSGPSKDKYGSLVKVASAKIIKNEKTGEIVSFDLSIVE